MVDTGVGEDHSVHVKALNWISNVGCVLSLGGVIIMCAAFTILKFHTENMKIHFNLGVAVGMADLVFLFEERAQENTASCVLVTILLYYFNMAVLSWMLIEGLFLYSQVVVVFVSARRWVKYYVYSGWLVPGFVMAVAMGILNVKLGTNDICWLSPNDNSIWAFAAPAIVVVIINFIILISVVRVIVSIQPDKTNHVKVNKVRNAVKGSIFLSPLLGTTWLFGLLSLTQENLLFEYLFATTNSLQGFFLFVFHCLCNSEVRADFSRFRHCKQSANHGGNSPQWFSGSFGFNVVRKFRNSISFDFSSTSHSEHSEVSTPSSQHLSKGMTSRLPGMPTLDEKSTMKGSNKLRRPKSCKSNSSKRRKRLRQLKRERTSVSQCSGSKRSRKRRSSSAISVEETPEPERNSTESTRNTKRNTLPPPLSMPVKNDVILTGKGNRIRPISNENKNDIHNNGSSTDSSRRDVQAEIAEKEAADIKKDVEDFGEPKIEENHSASEEHKLLEDETTNEMINQKDKDAFKIPMSYDSGLNSIDNESLLDEEYNDEFVEMPYGVYRVGAYGCDIVI